VKIKVLKGIFYTVILLSIIWSSFTFLVQLYSLEIDETSISTFIVDGDTFDIYSGDRIRLADIDTPEKGEWGYYEATEALRTLIYNKKVYLDIDDIGWTDRYGRLVCLVYVDYNSTHYLNVNEVLLVGGFASIWDHPNEFYPASWTLFVPKLGINGLMKLLLISSIVGVLIVFLINLILKKIWNHFPLRSLC